MKRKIANKLKKGDCINDKIRMFIFIEKMEEN